MQVPWTRVVRVGISSGGGKVSGHNQEPAAAGPGQPLELPTIVLTNAHLKHVRDQFWWWQGLRGSNQEPETQEKSVKSLG